MRKFFSFVWEFIQGLFNISQLPTTIVGVVGMVAIVWGVIWTWIRDLDKVQIILFAVAAGCVLFVFLSLFIAWRQRRNIESIPDLIEKLDVLTSNYIDDFSFDLSKEEWKSLNRDYGSVLGIDLSRLETELPKEHNQKSIDRAYESVVKEYERKLDPQNKAAESLNYLGDMGSLLDTYNVGLARLKETEQYQKLHKKIKSLQRKSPSAYISVKVNEYFTVSERLYIMLLGTKPLYEQPILREKVPAKVYAKKSQIRPLIDGQIANLIAGVRESITKYKERDLEQKTAEHTSNPPQNRAERRKK